MTEDAPAEQPAQAGNHSPAAPDRDATTLRRALRTGALAWALLAGALAVVGVAGGGSARAVAVAALLGLTLGSAVASGWLLLAAGLDLVAGEPPSRRRAIWTGAAVAFTLLSPLLLSAVPD